MEFKTRGVSSQIGKRLTLAKMQYTKLKRFKQMNENIQLRFYKTLIRPIMEYPVIPICISAKSNIIKMQQFQNRVLRNSTRRNNEDNELTIAELHEKYKIEAINVRLYRLACKVWDKLTITNEDLVMESEEEDDNHPYINDHFWWKRISPYIRNGEPIPQYTA